MSSKNADFNLKHRHAQVAMHHRGLPIFPPLLVNLGGQGILADYDDHNRDSSLMFGPGGAMFLPANPSNGAQPPQSQPQPQSSQASSQTGAMLSSSSSQSQSFASSAITTSQTPTSSVFPPSTASAPSTIAAASTLSSQMTTSTPSSNPSPQTSSPPSSSSQTQSQSQSQTSALSAASSAMATAAGGSRSSETSTLPVSGTLSRTGLPSSLPSLTASPALSSSSSTSVPPTGSESLPHLAAIVIGVIVAASLVAFLATLGSWFYKQRNHKNEHAEITSITSSSFDEKPRGFFGCLKKRSGKHTDDMSELGFGLGHVDFFGEPNSGDEHHRAGLTLGPENVVREDEEQEYDEKSFQPPRDPFADHPAAGFTDSAYPTVRPLPAHLQGPETIDGASSMTLSPYQHLAPARALGGTSATPLTVANFVPGDVSGDEGGRSGRFLAPPHSVARHGSLGTPRTGASAPRFMSLVEGDGLTVPWAPLKVRRDSPRPTDEERGGMDYDDAEEAWEHDMGFKPLALSRTSTLSLALSRTFSRRLGHSLSKTTDWRDGVTRPPPGTFRAAWDAQGDLAPQGDTNDAITTAEPDTWAKTLRNNFYSALNAVGSSIHASGDEESALPGPGRSLPNPYSVKGSESAAPSRRSSMRFPFQRQPHKEDLEDILTPPPARVAASRVGRSKGSLIRGHLGIAPVARAGDEGGIERGTGLGLGLEALSRSSTLSTSWSEAEKRPAWMLEDAERGTGKVRVRGLDHNERPVPHLMRSDTSSTASSGVARTFSRDVKPGRGRFGGRGRNLKPPSKRPRYSRMPVSQNSVWSSESYASTSGGEGRR